MNPETQTQISSQIQKKQNFQLTVKNQQVFQPKALKEIQNQFKSHNREFQKIETLLQLKIVYFELGYFKNLFFKYLNRTKLRPDIHFIARKNIQDLLVRLFIYITTFFRKKNN